MVLCDSSTLIHLAGIGRLELLRELYGKLIVPKAVWREVVEEGKGRLGVVEVQAARLSGWIEVRAATNEALALVSGLAFGIVPALQAARGPSSPAPSHPPHREKREKGKKGRRGQQGHQGRPARPPQPGPLSR